MRAGSALSSAFTAPQEVGIKGKNTLIQSSHKVRMGIIIHHLWEQAGEAGGGRAGISLHRLTQALAGVQMKCAGELWWWWWR